MLRFCLNITFHHSILRRMTCSFYCQFLWDIDVIHKRNYWQLLLNESSQHTVESISFFLIWAQQYCSHLTALSEWASWMTFSKSICCFHINDWLNGAFLIEIFGSQFHLSIETKRNEKKNKQINNNLNEIKLMFKHLCWCVMFEFIVCAHLN
jgi:hypothetical protein